MYDDTLGLCALVIIISSKLVSVNSAVLHMPLIGSRIKMNCVPPPNVTALQDGHQHDHLDLSAQNQAPEAANCHQGVIPNPGYKVG